MEPMHHTSHPVRKGLRTFAVLVTVTAALASTLMLAAPSGAIVAGRNADVGEYPWMVALRSGGGQFCGGSIIAPDTVVTAAHCVEGMGAGDIRVQAGVVDLGDRGQRIQVDRIVRHPEYNTNTVASDIALLRLSSDLTYNASVAPIAVRGGGYASAAQPGRTAWATGWGALDEQESAYSDLLLEVGLDLVGDQACNRALSVEGEGIQNRTMVCAGGDGADTCYGDSGGPLASRGDDGTWYLIGITSWGIVCGEPGLPSVYAQVDTFVSWIEANTPRLEGAPDTPQPQPEPNGEVSRTVARAGGDRIPARGSRGRTNIEIPVSGIDGRITDLNVKLVGLEHSFVSDLTVLLIAPDGTRATVFAEVGADGALNGTTIRINDEARRSFPTHRGFGRGAYRPTDNAQRFRPPADLSVFDGLDPNGTWTLRFIDSYRGDSGSVDRVRLIIRAR